MKSSLKELREKRGLNQTGMALILNVSQQTISRMECGSLGVPIDLAVMAAEIFEVSVDYFLGLTDETSYSPEVGKKFYIARQHEEFWEAYVKLSPEYRRVVEEMVHHLLEIQEEYK